MNIICPACNGRGIYLNHKCCVCVSVVCNCADHSNNNEICRWLGVTAGCASNYFGIHCREDMRGMVRNERR